MRKDNTLLIIILIAAMLVIANPSLLDGFTGNSPPTEVATQDDPADEYTAEDAATAISEHTPTGENDGFIPTAIPWTMETSLGDLDLLLPELEKLHATKGYDLNIVASDLHAGVSIWCVTTWFPTPFRTIDYSLPLPTQLTAGNITEVPKGRYCSLVVKEGELVGGVPSTTISQLQFYSLDDINEMVNSGNAPVYPYVTYEEVLDDEKVIDEENHTVTTTNHVNMTLHLNYGLWGNKIEVKNQVMHGLETPLGIVSDVATETEKADDRPSFEAHRNNMNTLAMQGADLALIAPINLDGTRDMKWLDLLLAEMRFGFSPESPTDSPYHRLKADTNLAAIAAGFSGVGDFRILLESPTGVEGEWVDLEALDRGVIEMVIQDRDLDGYEDNFYLALRDKLSKSFSIANLPPWTWQYVPFLP